MAEIDVADYYRLSAEHLQHMVSLAEKLADALLSPDEQNPKLQKHASFEQAREILLARLQDDAFIDALSVTAAVTGMQEEDTLSAAALHLSNRHKVRNLLQHLFSPHWLLKPTSDIRQAVQAVLARVRKQYSLSSRIPS